MSASFEKLSRLGAGYFGEVWLARETGLDVIRALKIIPKAKAINPSNFFQEAQILKAAEHPNVVRVEDTGMMKDGSIYVAMEYLKAGSLEDEAKGGYLPLARAKQIMGDALRGLEHAHSKGIIHRDIKPANMLIGATGEGKLSDFGLAMPKGATLAKLGMKEYMYILHRAPEIMAGSPDSELADIYASGVTLYRIVNGDSFFTLPPAADVSDLVAEGKFPDRSLYRDFVPRQWRVVINKAMNADSTMRFQSAAEMRRAIEKLKAFVNWQERQLSCGGAEWTAVVNGRCYRVAREKVGSNVWRIEVQKGRSKDQLRRVGELCSIVATSADARRLVQRILQDYVVGKLK